MPEHDLVEFLLSWFTTDGLFSLESKFLSGEITLGLKAPVIDQFDDVLGILILLAKLLLDRISRIRLRLILLVGLRGTDIKSLMFPSGCE